MFKKAFIDSFKKSFVTLFTFSVDQSNYKLFYPMTQAIGRKLATTQGQFSPIGVMLVRMIEEMNKAGTPTEHLIGQLCWYVKMLDKSRLTPSMEDKAEKYDEFLKAWMATVVREAAKAEVAN